jgi:hypothetical protein
MQASQWDMVPEKELFWPDAHPKYFIGGWGELTLTLYIVYVILKAVS